jgi:hypothetical protein
MLVPFGLQALVLFLDEFYFHHRRGLPRWEVIGHPLDTLTALIPLGIAFFYDWTPQLSDFFIGLSFFSCLFVVKDELIHKDICPTMEMVLHGLLFVLHPILFLLIYLLWQDKGGTVLSVPNQQVIGFQLFFVGVFFFYQIFYWGYFRGRSHQ